MKSAILAAFGLLALAATAQAQDPIEAALTAAPTRVKEAAAVISWNADYTYETLKEGTSHLVCYDRADQRDHGPCDRRE